MLTIFNPGTKRVVLNAWRVSLLARVQQPHVSSTLGGWQICSISTYPPLRENNDPLQFAPAVLASPAVTNTATSSSSGAVKSVPKSATSVKEENSWGALFSLPGEHQEGYFSVGSAGMENTTQGLYEGFLNDYLKPFNLKPEEKISVKTLYIKLIAEQFSLSLSKGADRIAAPSFYDLRKKLDQNDDLAIIPALPRIALEISDRKKEEGNMIDHEGFKYLSYLFKKWLGGDPFIITEATPKKNDPFVISDSEGVSMDWLIKAGSKEYYEKIISKDSFKTPSFISLLEQRMLEDTSFKYNEGEQFWITIVNEASPYDDMLNKHTKHLQTLKCFEENAWKEAKDYLTSLGGKAEKISGLSAAFHAFAFHAVMAGKITSVKSEKIEIEINQLAIYLKDSFDFSDKPLKPSQPLGKWPSFRIGESERITLTNTCFQRYRGLMGVGRDFYIFSKNKIVSPTERKWDKISHTFSKPANVKNKPF